MQKRSAINRNLTRPYRRRRCLGRAAGAAMLALPLLGQVSQGGVITFNAPSNISGDSDVFNVGTLSYAYDWANANVAVNGVAFTGSASIAGSGDPNANVGIVATLAPTGSTAPAGPIANSVGYGATVAPYSSLSANYKTILSGADYDNHTPGTDTFTVTLNSVALSHVYSLQVFESDARPKQGRVANISGGANTVNLNYSQNNVAGSPGQFTIGGFTATANAQSFNITGGSSTTISNPKGPNTQLNLLQLRDVTGVWSGGASGNWDAASLNFTGADAFSNVSTLVNTVYFADTDGFNNPITNNAITVQAGGVAIPSVIFQNNRVNYSVTGNDSTGITGTGTIVKTGTGQVALLSSNSYSGGTNVSDGTIIGASPAAFGSGSLLINPTRTTGTSTDAATVYTNGSISPSAGVTVNTNSATAIGTLVFQDASPVIGSLAGSGTVLLANTSGTVLTTGGGNSDALFSGTITDNGTGSLIKAGIGNFTLSGSNTYHGSTNVAAGTLTIASVTALPQTTTLNIANGASALLGTFTSPTAITVANVSGGGILNLNNNALVVHAGNLGAVTSMIENGYNSGAWNGSAGIISPLAAGDTTHLTAVGIAINDNGQGTSTPLYGPSGTIASAFDGAVPSDGDILVKYTYFGDTNLDGKIDASDYSRIDSGYLNNLTGWANGDFNYDGVVNGSDYTLIDNAFNSQGASLTATIAAPDATTTAQIAVPEPAAMPLAVLGLAILRRRKRRR
jgi:MYXO-CTERM domain-containing protein